jgi:hypothetical protein
MLFKPPFEDEGAGWSFIYPVAIQNTASRRIAENLHGEIIGNRTNPKYDSVVYRIPFYES